MKEWDVIVLGGGVSGCMAAFAAAKQGAAAGICAVTGISVRDLEYQALKESLETLGATVQ